MARRVLFFVAMELNYLMNNEYNKLFNDPPLNPLQGGDFDACHQRFIQPLVIIKLKNESQRRAQLIPYPSITQSPPGRVFVILSKSEGKGVGRVNFNPIFLTIILLVFQLV